MKTNQEKLSAFLSKAKKDSSWKEKAKEKRDNSKTLERSFQIALMAYQQLKRKGKNQEWLASELGVSPQSVSKMLKGNQSFRLDTIEKLENVLGIQLISVLATPEMDCVNMAVAKYSEVEYNGSAVFSSEATLNENSLDYHQKFSKSTPSYS